MERSASRRRFLQSMSAAAAGMGVLPALLRSQTAGSATPPNIVLLVADDLGVDLGCYGRRGAKTPNLDRLAAQGARYTNCFTHAPVCAPARCGLVTGQYPTTLGAHHMRSRLTQAPRMVTQDLQAAGYTVAWPGKTDFNFELPADAFTTRETWHERDVAPRQPFFGYVHVTGVHEGQIRDPKAIAEITRGLATSDRQDPAGLELPPYYPDTPLVRRQWANYFECVTAVDQTVGRVLERLEAMGVAENTVVVFIGDNGRGMPRAKRWLYDDGIHLPLIVRWPGRIKPGTVSDELVGFVDFAPTFLTLAGVGAMPERMQGQAFLGAAAQPARRYVYAARDRMDEVYDRIRAVRDQRFKYIRNFEPQLPYAQPIKFAEQTPILREWRRLHAAGELNPIQSAFFAASKPAEELYDTQADPWEVNNLASDSQHAAKLAELRAALDEWMRETGDLGHVPEGELVKRGVVTDWFATRGRQ
jgi:N-sulfoglucosamine sulfohydrolase